MEILEDRRLLTTFTVSNLADTGTLPGTLRHAIAQANDQINHPGIDFIEFDSSFTGSQKTINIINGPMLITDDIRIMGPSNGVKLQGSVTATTGLDFQIVSGSSNQSQISSLVISGFDDGIRVRNLQSSDTLVISNNSLESNDDAIDIFPAGAAQLLVQANTIRNNAQHGIYAHNGGGSGVALSIVNNTITGSGLAGIKYDFFDAFIDIEGNRIGITDGGAASSNDIGIWIKDSSSTATSAIFSNVISGNQGVNDEGIGIVLERSQFPALVIDSNQIGTNSSGIVIPGLGNEIGVTVQFNSSFNAIINNIIAGNVGDGLLLSNVQGGVIGTTNPGEGNTIILNEGDGIDLRGGTSNLSIEGNTVSTNLGAGIHLTFNAGTGNAISDNTYNGNGGLALDLESANGLLGFNPNDSNDPDPGPNLLQNYVDLRTPVNQGGGSWKIPFQLDVSAVGQYYIEFYKFSEANKSFAPLRTSGGVLANVVVDVLSLNPIPGSTVDAAFDVTFDSQYGLASGDKLSALMIPLTSFNTSEFSPPVQLGDVSGPKVVDVMLDGSSWSRAPYAFKDIINDSFGSVAGVSEQLRPIATQNANTIQIEFNEHVRKRLSSGSVVDIDASVLELKQTKRNSNGSITNESVSAVGFSYDPFKNVATWTFPDFVDGKYAIHLMAAAPGVEGIVDASGNLLNADWNNVISGTPDHWEDHPARPFVTGDATAGTAGNEFCFHFALLKGDYNGDGVVTSADTVSSSNPYSDGNGDGTFTTTGINSDIAVRDANLNGALPLREVGGADLNDDEKVDSLDLTYWQTGYGNTALGDVDGDGDSDGADFLLWQRAFGRCSVWADGCVYQSYAEAMAASLGLTLEDLTNGLPPQVENVIISGSQSQHTPFYFDTVDGSGSQLATVPVGAADTISIVFSENVNVSAQSLIVVGLTTANVPQLAEFSYDALTSTATWRFEGWALGDNYLLYLSDSITDIEGNFLDGEWTNPASISTLNSLVSTFPSGDGVSGGSFNFAMTLLAGDANLDGAVDGLDYMIWNAHHAQDGGFFEGDFDGDGIVGLEDIDIWYQMYGTNLQTPYLVADVDGNGKVDADDLGVLNNNYGMTGATWADGDLNGNGIVDDADLDLAFAQYGLDFDWVA